MGTARLDDANAAVAPPPPPVRVRPSRARGFHISLALARATDTKLILFLTRDGHRFLVELRRRSVSGAHDVAKYFFKRPISIVGSAVFRASVRFLLASRE